MKRTEVVVVLSCWLGAIGSAAAQESLSFTLDEVEQTPAPKRASKSKHNQAKPEKAEQSDAKQAIAQALGGLHWGMSKADLLKMVRAQIRADFEARIKVERDIVRQDALYQEAQERYRRVNDNYFVFDGQKTGWDVSPIAKEFSHGTGESMLVITTNGSRDLYFFMHDKLWKWYRELAPAAVGGNPQAALEAFGERFGRGKQQRERVSESRIVFPGTIWTDGTTRVTAMLRGNDTCLIFEEAAVVNQLAVLRRDAIPRRDKSASSSIVDSVLMSETELRARQ